MGGLPLLSRGQGSTSQSGTPTRHPCCHPKITECCHVLPVRSRTLCLTRPQIIPPHTQNIISNFHHHQQHTMKIHGMLLLLLALCFAVLVADISPNDTMVVLEAGCTNEDDNDDDDEYYSSGHQATFTTGTATVMEKDVPAMEDTVEWAPWTHRLVTITIPELDHEEVSLANWSVSVSFLSVGSIVLYNVDADQALATLSNIRRRI
jgi:hypothetical protein